MSDQNHIPETNQKSAEEKAREGCAETTCYAYPAKKEGKEYHRCEPNEATHLWFRFANEEGPRVLPVQTKGSRAGTGNWTWNGSVTRPTLKPSLLTDFGTHKCHVWISDGVVIHLSDCMCGMAGEKQHLAADAKILDYFFQHNDPAI